MTDIISNVLPSEDLSTRAYLRWDAKGVEVVPPNEAEDIQAVADMINEGQRRTWNSTRHGYSGTHARTQGIVKGTFIVPDDLPPHLKQTELFQHGGEYPVACRYSSEPGDPGLDVGVLFSYHRLLCCAYALQDRIPPTPGLCHEAVQRQRRNVRGRQGYSNSGH